MKNDITSTTRTTETVTVSRAEYERLRRENEQLEGRVRWLEEQLQVLAKNHFGSTHETASEEVIGQMALLFDEPEVYAHLEEIQQESVTAPEKKPDAEKKKRAFILDKLPENTEVKVETHQLSEAERTCPVCGAVMQPVGEEVVRTLEIIPAKFVVHEDHYENYKCTNCAGEDSKEEVGKTQFAKTPHIVIGEGSLIGHNVVLATLDHNLAPEKRHILHPAPIRIGNNVWIGAGVVVTKGVTIGDNSVIAAGAVVTRDIPPNVIAAGVPAKVLRAI